jgi:hypothetical protein
MVSNFCHKYISVWLQIEGLLKLHLLFSVDTNQSELHSFRLNTEYKVQIYHVKSFVFQNI